MSARLPKKSETIEIRLSHQAKIAFMDRCREERQSASEVLRALIDQKLAGRRRLAPRWRALAAAVAGLILGAVAQPSLARATQNSHSVFDRLDRNHDGVLSYAEFRAR